MNPTGNDPSAGSMFSGLSDEQLQRAIQIVQMQNSMGGSPETDKYLMSQFMNTMLPEEEESIIDVLGSTYALTEDENIKEQLLDEIRKEYGLEGGNPEQLDDLKLEEFKADYADSDKLDYYMKAFKQHPELLEQYSTGKPAKERFKWGKIPGYAGAGAAGGAVAGSVVPFFGNAVGALGGGVIGAGLGLYDAIHDKKTESAKEKEERLQKLITQYTSNLPKD